MSERDFTQLIYDKRGKVVEITLNRPDVLNALSLELYQEIGDAIAQAQSDREAQIIVITGAGRAFSTGGDIKQGDQVNRDTPQLFAEVSNRMLRGLLETDQIVIAKINGITQAGGLLIVAACDLAIASDQATFKSPEALIGLYEPYSHALLVPLIGARRTKHLLLTCETINAIEAERIGLINRVVPQDELSRATEQMIERILAAGPKARAMFKRMINQQIAAFDTGIVIEALSSEEGLEGMAAFAERRQPKWRE
jgi:enoyl-CoA hydratase/carnithine racemase